MNIIIPMAGRGQRFIDAGYDLPKPFIDIDGKPMISRVVENLNIDGKFIFLCLKEFLNKYGEIFRGLMRGIQFEIITVDKVTEGAACTVLLAKEHINNDSELIIANCDQLVLDNDWCSKSVQFFQKNNSDGGIPCFLNQSVKWSYVDLNEDLVVTQVLEKKPITNLATVGIYYYKQGNYFVGCAEDMINDNIRINNEFYVAPVYNYMISEGMKIIPYLVNEMVGLGTPEDLEKYVTQKS